MVFGTSRLHRPPEDRKTADYSESDFPFGIEFPAPQQKLLKICLNSARQ